MAVAASMSIDSSSCVCRLPEEAKSVLYFTTLSRDVACDIIGPLNTSRGPHGPWRNQLANHGRNIGAGGSHLRPPTTIAGFPGPNLGTSSGTACLRILPSVMTTATRHAQCQA